MPENEGELLATCPKCGNVLEDVWEVGDEDEAAEYRGILITKSECLSCHEAVYSFCWNGKDVWFPEDVFMSVVSELLLKIRDKPGKALAIDFTYYRRPKDGAWQWNAYIAGPADVYEGDWMPDANWG
jgi:hypothetical protein